MSVSTHSPASVGSIVYFTGSKGHKNHSINIVINVTNVRTREYYDKIHVNKLIKIYILSRSISLANSLSLQMYSIVYVL